MQKLPQKTPNKTQEHIAKIAEMFPPVISEGKVDFELLRQVLSEELVEGSDERYRLDWVGKRASLLKANRSINKTLRPCKQESVNFDTTENLYIEGDNFEVLKLIGESYLNKIKMIYIDPPYNTGKDFVYRDNFTTSKAEYEDELGLRDEEANKLFKNTDSNGRFHSDWLSMMYERLLLSRDLLREDGVIFISIDDNEVHNLRKICDEVFGEGNFISQFIWQKKKGGGNDSKHIAVEHEYILMYGKDKDNIEKLYQKFTAEYEKRYSFEDENGKYFWDTFKRKSGKQYYPITCPDSTILEFDENNNPLSWLRSEARFKEDLEKGEVKFEKKNNGWSVFFKQRMPKGKTPRSLLLDYGTTSHGSKELLNFFKKDIFQNPKPSTLVKLFAEIGLSKDDIILDFFSGSATTAHAVMQLNAEDGGNRKFIMVQLPEPTDEKSEAYKAGYHTIAEIGKERIRRAGKKIVEENADKEGIEKLDIGFRVLKVDSSNMKEVYYHPSKLGQQEINFLEDNIKKDRTPLDLLFATMLDLGIELSLTITPHQVDGATLYAVENNELVACFDESISLEVIEAIKALSPYQVVLKDGSFASDSDKINAIESLSKVATVSVL